MAIPILIVSDHRLTRTGLRQILKAAPDFQVVAEAEGLSALPEMCRRLHPEVILFDMTVPGPHGLRRAAAVLKAAPPARVVVVAANENVYYVRSLLAAGILGYVLRKASDQELFLAIRNAARNLRYLDPRLSDSLAEMLLQGRKSGAAPPPGGLSRREAQVLRAVAQGFTSSEIGRQLHLSHKTVETYRGRVYKKLGLRTRAALVQYAIVAGLLQEEDQDAS